MRHRLAKHNLSSRRKCGIDSRKIICLLGENLHLHHDQGHDQGHDEGHDHDQGHDQGHDHDLDHDLDHDEDEDLIRII